MITQKAQRDLGWRPKRSFQDLVGLMVEHDLSIVMKNAWLRRVKVSLVHDWSKRMWRGEKSRARVASRGGGGHPFQKREEVPSRPVEACPHVLIVFALGVVSFALYSIKLGQDINWDLQNYHFYTSYAFLNGRLKQDLLPSGIQSYLNPLLYLHYYLLVTHLPPPWAAAVVGGLQGLCVPLLYLLASRIVIVVSRWDRFLVVLFSTLVGVCSPILLSEVGTSFADIYSAQLITISLIILFGRDSGERVKPAQILGAGIIVGAATGLKLTNALFALAGALSILLVMAPRVAALCIWASGNIIGFALTGGVWALRVFETFGNPFFPYLNRIFRSPLYELSILSDRRYIPGSVRAAIAYPFQWFSGISTTAEVPFTDARFAVLSVLLVPAAAMLIRSVVNASTFPPGPGYTTIRTFTDKIPARFISLFFLTSYVLWLATFSMHRYAVPLELLSGVFLLILCDLIARDRSTKLIMFTLFSIWIIVWVQTTSWGRVPWSESWFAVNLPKELRDNNAIYLKPEYRNSYLIPFFPPDARFFEIGTDTRLDRAIKHIINDHKGPLRVLAYDHIDVTTGEVLKRMGLQIGNCLGFSSKNDRFVACNLIGWQEGQPLEVPLPYSPLRHLRLGSEVSFRNNGAGSELLERGWSAPEDWGTWTDGSQASLSFRITDVQGHALVLRFGVNPFIAAGHPTQRVDISANGEKLANWEFGLDDASGVERTIVIPFGLLNRSNGLVKLVFDLRDAKSPAAVGMNSDPRRLGVGITSMKIERFESSILPDATKTTRNQSQRLLN